MAPHGFLRQKTLTAAFSMAMLCCMFFISCKHKDKWVEVDPAFSKYIDAYTSGIISKTSALKIELAADATTSHPLGEATGEELFTFSPSVKGKTIWLDARTVEFKPDQNLQPDQLYEVSFELGKVTNVPAQFKTFRFNVKTLKPSFEVNDMGLRSNGERNKMTYLGELVTADVEASAAIEKVL